MRLRRKGITRVVFFPLIPFAKVKLCESASDFPAEYFSGFYFQDQLTRKMFSEWCIFSVGQVLFHFLALLYLLTTGFDFGEFVKDSGVFREGRFKRLKQHNISSTHLKQAVRILVRNQFRLFLHTQTKDLLENQRKQTSKKCLYFKFCFEVTCINFLSEKKKSQ